MTSIGSIQTWEYLVESTLDPNAIVVANPPGVEPGSEGAYSHKNGWSKMPEFIHVMTVEQMLNIAEFLMTLKGEADNAELYPESGEEGSGT